MVLFHTPGYGLLLHHLLSERNIISCLLCEGTDPRKYHQLSQSTNPSIILLVQGHSSVISALDLTGVCNIILAERCFGLYFTFLV